MKNTVIYISIFTAIFLSCGKEPVAEEGLPYSGTATALKNGEPWEAKIYAYSSEVYLLIAMDYFNGAGFKRGHLGIFKIPKKIGKYAVKNSFSFVDDKKTGANYFAYIDDGDLGAGTWFVEEDTIESEVEISYLNELTGEVSGTFNLEFSIDSTTIDSRYYESGESARITFGNGVFSTKIAEIK
ncbi:MAG TPA: hypothetical protein PKE06_04740 [Flavilitoribacter sp.]|nr:hypothetical protein [Flavilitoribacter sp.]HMQ86217.1 hypothetical protein [Flavilitoribacter sp.]